MNYAQYGPKNPFNNVLSNNEMLQLQAEELVDKIKSISKMEHRVLYYGPRSVSEIETLLEKYHVKPGELTPLPEIVVFEQLNTDSKDVFWTNYDMVQTEFMVFNKGSQFDKSRVPQAQLFNEYFGGGMNSIVFQEIREAQGLAYSAFSRYNIASKAESSDVMFAYIGTQSDKQSEAMAAIRNLIENMPESQTAFDIAKQSILSKIESERITKSGILWNYEAARKQNLDYDIRKDVYEKVQTMTFADLMKFHSEYIKGINFISVLIGNKENINFDDLKKYGEVHELSLDEIFGFENSEKVNVELQE
ncbi:MAG: insulinase family protein, partial [Cyclobacteriaceae bacterium]|nr:insulinase family protein [Cyclobacteriaceae bacterium]